jgi:sec-independent protein translocase protein TatA
VPISDAMPIGLPELLIVLFVILLILGPKRLPALGRSLGGGLREFKDSIRGRDKDGELPASTSTTDESGLDGEVVREPGR